MAFQAHDSENELAQLLSELRRSRRDSNRIEVLVKLANHYKPDSWDSTYRWLVKAIALSDSLKNNSWKNEALAFLGAQYLAIGEKEKGAECFMKIIKYHQSAHHADREARAWSRFAKAIFFEPVNIPDKIVCFENAYRLFKRTGNLPDAIGTLKDIAECHVNQRELTLAEKELLDVLRRYDSIRYTKVHFTYQLLGEIQRLRGDVNRQLFYYLEQVRNIDSSGDTTSAIPFLLRLAVLYTDLSDYPASRKWATRLLDDAKKRHLPGDVYQAVSLITFDYISEGRVSDALAMLKQLNKEIPPVNFEELIDTYEMYGNCYTALNEFSRAEVYYKKMLALYEKTVFENLAAVDATAIGYLHTYKVMCAFYLKSKHYEKADFYLMKLQRLPQSFIKPVMRSKIYRMKFQVDSALHRYSSALANLRIHKAMDDSIFSTVQSGKVAELQARFESERTDQELIGLHAREHLQAQQVQRARQEKIFTYLIVASLLIIIGIGYHRYRLKARNFAALTAQQLEINNQNHLLRQVLLQQQKLVSEKELLVKEIHHRVKNNLQMMISLLNAQSEFIDNPTAQAAIGESRERMHAIALIHRELTMLERNTILEIGAYIHSMLREVETRDTFHNRITFTVKTVEVKLDISIAVLVALFLSESVNYLDKCCDAKVPLALTVDLESVAEERLRLRISAAPGAEFKIATGESLNIQLMRLFSEQVNGIFICDTSEQNGISLTFPASLILPVPADTAQWASSYDSAIRHIPVTPKAY